MSCKQLAAFALAFVCVTSASLGAQAPPSRDAYVTNTQPFANFGDSVFLPVQRGTNSYIKFNLGTLPMEARIAKATLRLYVNAVIAPGSFDVYEVQGAWSEHGVNFNNQPTLGASASGGRPTSVTAASLHQFILVDITPLAQSWLSGFEDNNGVALALTTANGGFAFDSKESTGPVTNPNWKWYWAMSRLLLLRIRR
jgi:hypothetical protein